MLEQTRRLSNLSVASRSQRVSLIVIPFCLSVWMSVGHSATCSLPRLIDYNQIWSAGIYLSSDLCKPFWIPIYHSFGAKGKNMHNFAYFQWQPFNTYSCHCERDASCHMTCLSVGLVVNCGKMADCIWLDAV